MAGTFGDAQRRGVREPVGGADDEVVERVARVEVDRVAAGRERRHGDLRLFVDLLRDRSGRIGDDEFDLDRAADDPRQGLADQRSISVVEPVACEAIRCGDPVAVVLDLDELCVLEPGLEVCRGEADLQLAEGGAPHLLGFHQSRVSEPKCGPEPGPR